MARVYKPYETDWETMGALDPKRCKAALTVRYHDIQCSRKAVKGGWCTQHHPDAQAKRDREAAELRDFRYKNSDAYKLKEALKRIEDLEEEAGEMQECIAKLEAELHL